MAEDRMLSDEILLGLINKNSGGGGGTGDYNQLENLPQIGGNTLIGNKSLADLGIASKQSVSDITNGESINNFAGVETALSNKQATLATGDYISISQNEISVNREIPAKNYSYEIVTKSTGGNDASVTIKKYANGTLVSSTDYIYNQTGTVNVDGYFTFQWASGWKYTLLQASTTHAEGYTASWSYLDVVDITEVFPTEDTSGLKLIIKAELDAALATKQNATDNSLETEAKTIVGAINEHEGDIASLKSGLIGLSVDVDAPKRKNIMPLSLANIKESNTSGTWSGNAYTANDVTFTVNTDSNGAVTGITVNGTASATTYFTVYSTTSSDGNMQGCILNGCPSGGTLNTYLMLASNTVDTVNRDMGSGVTISANDRATFRVQISITNGYAASNLAFTPMVRLASESDSAFAPYIPSLENRIETVESGKIGVAQTTNLNDCTTTGVYTFAWDATGVPSGHSGVMFVMRNSNANDGLQIARVSTENTIYVRFYTDAVFTAWQTITLGS